MQRWLLILLMLLVGGCATWNAEDEWACAELGEAPYTADYWFAKYVGGTSPKTLRRMCLEARLNKNENPTSTDDPSGGM